MTEPGGEGDAVSAEDKQILSLEERRMEWEYQLRLARVFVIGAVICMALVAACSAYVDFTLLQRVP